MKQGKTPFPLLMLKTKPGSRSKGWENRTKNIRKKITGAMKRKKPDFQDEDWIQI